METKRIKNRIKEILAAAQKYFFDKEAVKYRVCGWCPYIGGRTWLNPSDENPYRCTMEKCLYEGDDTSHVICIPPPKLGCENITLVEYGKGQIEMLKQLSDRPIERMTKKEMEDLGILELWDDLQAEKKRRGL